MSCVVLVGGGQASSVAARTLRRRGYDGSIVLLAEERERPYQRPPLSKEYLLKGEDPGLHLIDEQWAADKAVDVRLGTRATRIRPEAGGVELADGTLVTADHVLIATGGRARRFLGAVGDRIRYLRTKADADALRAHLGPQTHVVVVGAGFIGSEVASTARELGADVTLLETAALPLLGVLGDALAGACARLPRAAGVDLRCGVTVESITQIGEKVTVATDGGRLDADLVVVGIGIEPNEEIAAASGLTVGNGVHVDERCRTDLANVYAAGDVANQYHPLSGARLRVEHFDNASKQAAVAANNMLGRTAAHTDAHWFWSDQYGANLQGAGRLAPGLDVAVRGDLEDDSWTAFFLDGGVVKAAFAMNRSEDVMVARELINLQRPVSAEVLRDPSTELMEILEQE